MHVYTKALYYIIERIPLLVSKALINSNQIKMETDVKSKNNFGEIILWPEKKAMNCM